MRKLTLLATALAVIAGAACSSGTPKASSAAFCRTADATFKAFDSGGDPSAKLTQLKDESKKKYRHDIAAFQTAVRKAASAHDDSAFLSNGFRENSNALVADVAEGCRYRTVDVAAREFAFSGIGPTVPAGSVAFHLRNEGAQMHEFYLYRRAAGTTGDLVTILNSNPHVDDGRLTELGVTLPIASHQDSYLTAKLTAGDYVAVCLINDGTKTVKQLLSQSDGGRTAVDHRAKGMVTTFTVR